MLKIRPARRAVLMVSGLALLLPVTAFAQGGPLEVPADTAWLITASALVFFMQAGFALLEGGSSRAKNAVNVIMKNYADMCFGMLAFWLIGFGLMFGDNPSGFFGTSHFAPAELGGRDASYMIFQSMFAATAATIVSGAVAERMKFAPYVFASMLITGVVYAGFGSWAWGGWFGGGGWLAKLGFTDFAGSTVVHSVGGWSALAGVMVVGPRLGRFSAAGMPRHIPGHNLSNVALGGFVLWLGWFGFNGGSTLAANASVGPVVLNTHLAGSAGFMASLMYLSLTKRPVLMTTTVNGAIGGLVAITAGCATMNMPCALITGAVAGVLVCVGQDLMERLRLDDVVGAIPVHAFCGAWGTLATGVFYHGDMFDPHRILIQMLGIGVAFAWTFCTSYVLFWGIDRVFGLRAESLHEQRGLDFTEHYEIGYPEFQRELTHGGKS